MISAIVAMDENNGIGFNGQLLEKIPEDLRKFKFLTQEKIVVMGRKTWESLPKKPLPNRLNIIISNKIKIMDTFTISMSIEEIKSRLEYASKDQDEEWFIIGGGQIYNELLPFCDRIYITKIYKKYENVDTYFPNIDEQKWNIVHQSEILTYNNLQYQFLTYDRIN